ncbi:DER1-domain-containing protein [Coprinopsis marcescibilis]|uniref:Derlin n=1 Tax=Coprinopsis marcescibilis TaxID=230819 RepID=A0A5C3L6S9_COPMA|nr:DER1-domain-containing protein [Coprinopsis marcescibilis]
MDQLVAELRKIPPVTRFMSVSTVGLTIPVLLNLLSPYQLLFVWSIITRKFQLWRLYTSFFLGSPGINFIFEVAMLYRTSNQLETGVYESRSGEYAWHLFLSAVALVISTRPLGSFAFLHPLLATLTYLSSQFAPPGSQTMIMGVLPVPVAFFPYFMVGMDLLMGGPRAAAESVAGLIIGHGWWWGIWGGGRLGGGGALSTWARPPRFVLDFFRDRGGPAGGPSGSTGGGRGVREDDSGAAAALRASGIQVVPPRNVRETSSRGSGHSWGSGQKLGT